MHGRIDDLGAVIGRILGQPQYVELKKFDDIKVLWREIAGGFIADNTRVDGVSNGVMTVTAGSSAFVFELKSMKNGYVAEYAKRAPGAGIRDIFFRFGDVRAKKAPPTHVEELLERAAETERYISGLDAIEIPADVEESIRGFVDSLGVSDEGLREKMASVSRSLYRVTRYKKEHGYVECGLCGFLFEPGTAGADGELCTYCDVRMKHGLSASRKRILEKPWEDYAAYERSDPGVKPREFEYIRKKEIAAIRAELDRLIVIYVSDERRETFAEIDRLVRRAMSFNDSEDYSSIKEFGEARMARIAAVLGPNVRSVFARGTLISKL